MYRQLFFLGIFSAIASSLACYFYTKMYYSLLVDFSEAASFIQLSVNCLIVAMIGVLVNSLFRKLVKNTSIADFVFNLIFSLLSIGAVFYTLNANDPNFKNEDAQLFADFYKGFVMPMLFFPLLTWFTLKPLFVKS